MSEKKKQTKEKEPPKSVEVFSMTLTIGDYIKVIVGRLVYYGRIKGFHINPYYVTIEDIYGQTAVLNLTKATMITKIDEETYLELKERAKMRMLKKKMKRMGAEARE
ncbi:MAG: hypothetical protein DRP11_01985 [Candidatus Aenigmatarchaeota archaeon]|nr:MAG: hypothetical protein DRP11_01985 [Candidatus Aenigmarchaeota archaeon]